MAVWECAECTAKYSVGAPKCPQCGSTVRVNDATQPEEEQDMPKVTVHGGPSIEGFHVDPETSEITPIEPDETEGGEDVSAGSSSSTSSEMEPSTPEQSETPDQSPAPKTGNRSAKGRTGSSTARTTGGGRETGTSETDSADKGA